MLLEEFYQSVYHDFFFKWLVLNTKTYIQDCVVCKIEQETDQLKMLSFDIGHAHGEVTIWFTNIIEERITNKDNNQILFYLHYTITDLAQCRTLFQEFYHTLLTYGNEKIYKVALCGHDGLSTSAFIDEMKEVSKMDNLSIHLDSLSLDELKSFYQQYDVVYLAPQIAYTQPEILTFTEHLIPIHRIDPTDFATKDYQAIINIILKNRDIDKKREAIKSFLIKV